MEHSPENQPQYSRSFIWLHWIMALMFIVMALMGTYISGLEPTSPERFKLLGLHKSFGVIFMLLTITRLFWRNLSGSPSIPKAMSNWEKILSKLVTAALLLLMVLIPFSGFAYTNFLGFPVSLFGLIELPVLFDKNLEFAETAVTFHKVFVYSMVVCIFLHVVGAIKHRYFDRMDVDVLPRMLPFLKPLHSNDSIKN